MGLSHGVMVTQLILVQSFKVRILVRQQKSKPRFSDESRDLLFLILYTENNISCNRFFNLGRVLSQYYLMVFIISVFIFLIRGSSTLISFRS